jgi:hypothetical protein
MRVFFILILLLASTAKADFRERYKEGMFAEALTELEASPEASERGYAYYLNRGLIHHALNQDPLAVANLLKARALNPSGKEVDEPLAEATAILVKELGRSRLDPTSNIIETAGDAMPLDLLFSGFAVLSLMGWFCFFIFPKKRKAFAQSASITLGLAALFGAWGLWMEHHPLFILTESRMVKSGPGESYFDRGPIDIGVRLRIVDEILGSKNSETDDKPTRWWKVRFNERHDLGYLPEQSGLLLTDESNTPNR